MSNQLLKLADHKDKDILIALRASVYPGAKEESVFMALAYCKAAKLDPLQKPVHIVAMNVKDAKTGVSAWRDVIMPGIGLYRIQASRSGKSAGISEPDYGEEVTETIGTKTITYPKWCRMVAYKIEDGRICEYASKEFWKENFAAKSDGTPNAMWSKRPYAQLAKCTEAQCLRKAFPELVGAQPTAEEMEGKTIDSDEFETLQTTPESIKQTEEKPASRVESLKRKIGAGDNNNDDQKVFDPEAIKKLMDEAKNMPELSNAINLSNRLEDPDVKKSLREAFKAKKEELEKSGA